MSTKADFLTAVGATTAVGTTKAFTAAAGNLITLTSHGLGDRTGPVQVAVDGEGSLPGGLAAATNYWLLSSTANAIQLCSSAANAAAGVVIDLTSVGVGNFTIAGAALTEDFEEAAVNVTDNEITMTAHGAITGYGPVRFSLQGDASALPAGLAAATDYWLIRVSDNVVKVATSLANALAGTAIDITDDGTDGTGTFRCARAAVSDAFTTTDVTIASGAVTATAHGRETGFGPVRLTTDGALPAGLAVSTDYWLINVDANTIQFASSRANALAGTAIDIQDAGSGTNTMRCTMQTIAEQMEQCLQNVLTFPGNKDMPADINTSKFWDSGVISAFV